MAFITQAINTAIAVVVSSFIGGIIGAVISRHKSNAAHSEALEQAVNALTHDAFFRYCRYILEKQHVTSEEYENLEHLYKSYRSLGMNGTGERLYEECRKMPIRTL